MINAVTLSELVHFGVIMCGGIALFIIAVPPTFCDWKRFEYETRCIDKSGGLNLYVVSRDSIM